MTRRNPIDDTADLRHGLNLSLGSVRESLVMMVDDEPLVIEITQAFLEQAGYRRFVSTSDSTEALAMALRERPDVLLLDINMPKVSGFEVLAAMRLEKALKSVPVIVLTSADDSETKLRSLELGASDFLRKPVDPSELALRMKNTLAAKAHQDFLAHYDAVTELPNRPRFMEQLERTLLRSREHGDKGALLQFDLDRFKQVNEALGPAIGDQLLQQAAKRLAAELKAMFEAQELGHQSNAGYLARFGGDEFSVILAELSDVDYVARAAQRLLSALAQPYQIQGHDIVVTTSIGTALFPADGMDVDTVVKNAGVALSQAKQGGRGENRFYSKEFNAMALQRLSLEGQLRHAVEQGELRLFYQPKFHVATRQLSGAEALLRWQHPQRGLVPPMEFIPIAEQSGLIVPIGEWVLLAACRQNVEWAAQGLPRVPIAVNVSPRQFRQTGFAQAVKSAIAATGQVEYLRLELTESSIMDDPESAIRVLQELKALGIKLSIDDFGTGYSSMSYLNRLPLGELKIDRSFLAEIKKPDDRVVLVDAIIALAHSLGLNVVAEGVETDEQLQYLARRNCDEAQGFLFSKPVPADEFSAKFLRSAAAA
jgi:diguanylate cyclase (GGDEF)-like protein